MSAGPRAADAGSNDGDGALSLVAVCKADMRAMARLKGIPFPSPRSVADLLMLPGTWAVLIFRVATYLHDNGLRPLSRILYFANTVLFSADLAPGAQIGPGLAIAHPVFTGWGSGLRMGRDVVLTGGVRFGTAAVKDPERAGHPVIGDECYFMDAAKVLGAVTIGDRSVIAANALVLDDVPPDSVVVGMPARVVRKRWETEGEEIGEAGTA
jgi:serine O-acetyltransferase